MLKGNIVHQMGKIITTLHENGFLVNNGRLVQFSNESAKRFFGNNKKADMNLTILMNVLIKAPCVGFELVGENAVTRIKRALAENGTTKQQEGTLRTLLNDEEIRNGILCSQSEEEAHRELQYFFDPKSEIQTCVALKNSTLALIKPHALKEGKAGPIISELYEKGFKITGLKMFLLERANCEEFYEIYRGVLPEYIQMVAQLASGVCMALEITLQNKPEETHAEFRKLCGPMDPEIGRQLRPHTLRAKYGNDKIQNALHCTDLPDDTLLEIEYFFKILE